MEFGSNWRVLTSRRSSMTDRLAHLYDRELFALVEDEFGKTPRRLPISSFIPRAIRELIRNIKIGSAVIRRRF